jgi:divalent metal cation (Fe/Co/Zn/Cd) transporter
MLCYSVENCIDFAASLVVLWRFHTPPKLPPDRAAQLAGREQRASLAISIVVGLLGGGIMGGAIWDYVRGAESVHELRSVLWISLVSMLVLGLLAIFKFHYSVMLRSASLQKNGLCSLIGTALATALFVNTLIIQNVPKAWWIDALIAWACGVVAICMGIHAVVEASVFRGLPIFTYHWWAFSQGDGLDELMDDQHLMDDDDYKAVGTSRWTMHDSDSENSSELAQII